MAIRDADGRLTAVIGRKKPKQWRPVGNDNAIDTAVSATKRNHLLVRSEIRYRRLFESAKDGILILDAISGKIEDVNPFLIDLLGYTHDEFVNKFIWDIGLFKDMEPNREYFLQLKKKAL